MILTKRSFLIGAGTSLITAPAIVRASSLMPVRVIKDYINCPEIYVKEYWNGKVIHYEIFYGWRYIQPEWIEAIAARKDYKDYL